MKLELIKGSRSRILAAVILGIAAIFVVRLFYLQVIQHDHYKELASQEQTKRLTIPATRGVIYAKSGNELVQLVMNETVYTLFADPAVVGDKEKVVKTLREVAGGNLRQNFDQLLDRTETRYQILGTKLTRAQADKIKEARLSGIGFQAVSQRVYPESGLAAHVLGFVNVEGVGNYGIEGAMNERLTGVDGKLESVTDVSDVPLTIGNRNINVPAKNGTNIVLSIDRNIQTQVEKALDAALKRTGATKASAIVIDPNTGKTFAMANLPTYKPAEFNKVQDGAVFNNAVISVPYEPGSVIKTFTMATALNEGVVKPTDTYNNTDYIRVEDITISNASKGQLGTTTFQKALNWSLNTGFVTIAQRLGDGKQITRGARDTMYKYFHDRFYLGKRTGIELSGEAAGIIIPPTEIEGNAVRYSNMSFGQGLDVTMLQVAAGFSAMINGGTYYKPTVIDGEVKNGEFIQYDLATPVAKNLIDPAVSKQMREMTHGARYAFSYPRDKPGYYIGGKTGTSQAIVNGKYSDDETIATYLGYGGNSDGPRYVIMVQVSSEKRALSGVNDAQPIFTEISNWMLDYLKIQPKG